MYRTIFHGRGGGCINNRQRYKHMNYQCQYGNLVLCELRGKGERSTQVRWVVRDVHHELLL